MKKIIFTSILIISLVFNLSSCILFPRDDFSDDIVVSSDYESITYNSKNYIKSEFFMDIPDDAYSYNVHVEGNSSLEDMDIFYDVVYISESYPEYLWLDTDTDTINGYELKKHGTSIMYEAVNE